MNRGTLVVLALLCVSLGTYILLFERKTETTEEARRAQRQLLPGFKRDAVRSLAIEPAGKPPILLERKAAGEPFRIVKPEAVAADTAATDGILGALEGLEIKRTIGAPGARGEAQYGLGGPHLVVRVDGIALHVGGKDATGEHVYAARGDEPVVLVVPRRFRDQVDRDLDGLRERAVLAPRGDATRLVVDGTTVTRTGGRWLLEDRTRASAQKVEDALRAVEGLKATRFLAPGSAAVTPSRRLARNDAEAAFGGACPGHAGEVLGERKGPEPVLFCVAADALGAIALPRDRLRETQLVTVRPGEVRGIVITGAGVDLELARDDKSLPATWAFKKGAPKDAKADDEAIQKWLTDLGAYRAQAFVPAAGFAAQLEVRLETEAGPERLAFGAGAGGRRLVRRGDEPVALEVHAEVDRHIPRSALAFRSRQALSFNRFDAVRLTAGEELARKDGEKWRLDRPIRAEADFDTIDALLGTLADLRAERFVAERAEPAHGLPGRRIEVELQPAPGAPSRDAGAADLRRVVEIGRDVPGASGECHARAGGDGPVFVLPKPRCEELRAPLVTRKLLDFDEAQLERIVIARGERRFAAEKRGPTWYRLESSGDALEQGKIDEAAGALRDLRADRVLGYGEGAVAHRLAVQVRVAGQDHEIAFAPTADGAEARRKGLPVLYHVAKETLDRLDALLR